MSDNTYKEYLEAKHADWQTPRQLINKVVLNATSQIPKGLKKLIAGHDNEVYDVSLANRGHVIVRISRFDDPRYEAEKWAMQQCQVVGVPTPTVFSVSKEQCNNRELSFCVEEKMSGEALSDLLKSGRLTPNEQQGLIDSLGEIIGNVHAIKINGFGYLQPRGDAWPIQWRKIMLDLLDQTEQLHQHARQVGIDSATIDTALQLLREGDRLYDYSDSRLTHGDFGAEHVLVTKGKITGIIDMQGCSGNHPLLDFVWWQFYWGKQIDAKQFMPSYSNPQLLSGDNETLFHLMMLRHCPA